MGNQKIRESLEKVFSHNSYCPQNSAFEELEAITGIKKQELYQNYWKPFNKKQRIEDLTIWIPWYFSFFNGDSGLPNFAKRHLLRYLEEIENGVFEDINFADINEPGIQIFSCNKIMTQEDLKEWIKPYTSGFDENKFTARTKDMLELTETGGWPESSLVFLWRDLAFFDSDFEE